MIWTLPKVKESSDRGLVKSRRNQEILKNVMYVWKPGVKKPSVIQYNGKMCDRIT